MKAVANPPSAKSGDVFRSKYNDVARIITDWLAPVGGLEGKRILDFGCGEGTTALALALSSGGSRLVGSDISRKFDECSSLAKSEIGVTELPGNLEFEEVAPGEVSACEGFDLVYSWSVFEHIDLEVLPRVISRVYSRLLPGGHFFVQIAPLFYSPEGGHLWALENVKWEHLTMQLNHIKRDLNLSLDRLEAESIWNMFVSLNKMTAQRLLGDISKQGFRLLREYTTRSELVPPSELLQVYEEEVLLTDQIVALFEKP